jgi:hypothetical protein
MLNRNLALSLTGLLALGACAVAPPSAPTVLSTPPEGKDLAKFQQEDMNCRGYAMNNAGGTVQSGTNAGVGSAVAGTALGAAAGALLGSAGGAAGAGAAVGAGIGLLAGSAVGADQARSAGYSAQQIFDMAYSQCMTASGNKIEGPIAPAYGYAAPGYAAPGYPAPIYAAPYPYYAAPYPYYGPSVVIGPRWGYGYGYGWRGRRW